MTQKDRFKINKNADLEQLGKMVEEAMEFHEVRDYDSVRDMLFELHHQIYPNASRPATPEEIATITADEPKADRPNLTVLMFQR